MINSLSPILVVILSVPLLGSSIKRLQVVAGLLGMLGVALLVLRSNARLDAGLIAMVGAVLMMGTATVLTKRWGTPAGMTSIGVTGWTFLLGGLTLLPFTLIFEGLPDTLTGRNIAGLVYLVLISGIVAYALWFWGLQYLTASSVDLPQPAQSRRRRRARLDRARPVAQPLADPRRGDRAGLGDPRPTRRVRAAQPEARRRYHHRCDWGRRDGADATDPTGAGATGTRDRRTTRDGGTGTGATWAGGRGPLRRPGPAGRGPARLGPAGRGPAGRAGGRGPTRHRASPIVAGRAASTPWAPNPTPGFTFANERTFLAWIRTGLGFLAAGVAIAAVARLTAQLGVEVRIASLILIACGLICAGGRSAGGSPTSERCVGRSHCLLTAAARRHHRRRPGRALAFVVVSLG